MNEINPNSIEINKFNLLIYKDIILEKITDSDFISIDLEFSGLGSRSELSKDNIQQRHEVILELVQSFGLLELGLSCFKVVDQESSTEYTKDIDDYTLFELSKNKKPKYDSYTFNFLLCRQDVYSVSSSSLVFLKTHGFDFNYWLENAIPYTPKAVLSDHTKSFKNKDLYNVVSFINSLLSLKKPLILHNGNLDIIYLYFTFFGSLQKDLNKSIIVLAASFPILFDTKYIGEYSIKELKSTFLEELFFIVNPLLDALSITITPKIIEDVKIPNKERLVTLVGEFCKSYLARGHCRFGDRCVGSHDIYNFLVNKKRKIDEEKTIIISKEYQPRKTLKLKIAENNSKCHSAGYDSFMTGVIAVYYFSFFNYKKLGELKNKINLGGKDFPLIIKESEVV